MREGWRKLVSDFRFSLGLQISAVLVAADVLFVVCNQMTLHQFQQRYNQEMEQYRAVLNLKKNIRIFTMNARNVTAKEEEPKKKLRKKKNRLLPH